MSSSHATSEYYTPRTPGLNFSVHRKSQPVILSRNGLFEESTQASEMRPSTQVSKSRMSQQSKIPKKLAMQLGKISSLFVTELMNTEVDENSRTVTTPCSTSHHTTEAHSKNGFRMHYFRNEGSQFGSRSLSTASLTQIKRSTVAIEEYKAASRKLKILLIDQQENLMNKKRIQTADKQSRKANSGINLSNKLSLINLPKSTFSHGFSQLKDFKGYLSGFDDAPEQRQSPNTPSNNNLNSFNPTVSSHFITYSKDTPSNTNTNLNTNTNINNTIGMTFPNRKNSEAFEVMSNNNNINMSQQNQIKISNFNSNNNNNNSNNIYSNQKEQMRIVQQINTSKFCERMASGMEEELSKGKYKFSQLQYDLQLKEKQLYGLKSQDYAIDRNEIHEAIILKQQITKIQSEIDEIEELIYDQERLEESLHHMKEQREKDLLINSEPTLNYSEAIKHLSRFLAKTTDSLYEDSKKINKIYLGMTKAGQEVKMQESLLQTQWRSEQIREQKEQEAERLAEFESTMREISKNQQQEEKRFQAEERKQKKLEEEKRKNALGFQLQGQIDTFNHEFIEFHETNKAVSSCKDLLEFCVHVKINTEKLKKEEDEYKERLEKLNEEVNKLNNEYKELKYTMQTKSDVLIIQHNQHLYKKQNEREDDFINLADIEKQVIEEKRKEEIVEYELSKKMKQQQQVSVQFSGMYQRFFAEMKKSPPHHLTKLQQKPFDLKNPEESIQNFTASIMNLQDLISDIQQSGQLRISQSIKTPSNQEDQIQEYPLTDSKMIFGSLPLNNNLKINDFQLTESSRQINSRGGQRQSQN